MRTIEILSEEKTIIEEDAYNVTSFEFFPEDKKFTIEASKKEDCFYNYLKYEYRISTNPIKIDFRLLEKSHEPPSPREHEVKDGVVLESEILKNGYSPERSKERIFELKKQIEWSNVEIFGNYEINLYILSLHPEIVSGEEYRKFLRQSVEKIKSGVGKVEEAVKGDARGLEISKGEYGRSIWYPNAESEKKEMNEYYDLPEDKRKGTDYAKKIEYIEKFNNSLFNEDSLKYVGILKDEFTNSDDLIKYISKLLNSEVKPVVKDASGIQNKNNHTNKNTTIIVYLVTVFLIILKLTDTIDWNWFAVISPVIIWEGFGFIVGFLKSLNK